MRSFTAFILISAMVSSAFADPEKWETKPYVSRCEEIMDAFQKPVQGGDVEKRFLELANDKEKMAQLLYDYNLIFSPDLARAIVETLKTRGLSESSHNIFESLSFLKALNNSPPEAFNRFVWEVVETMVTLRSKEVTNGMGKVKHVQITNLVRAIRESPHKVMVEEILGLIVRHSVIQYAIELKEKEAEVISNIAEKKATKVAIPTTVVAAVVLPIAAVLFNGNNFLSILFGEIFAGLSGAYAYMGTSLEVGRNANVLVKYKMAPKSLEFIKSLSETERLASNEVLAFLNRSSRESFLPLDKMCGSTLCDLNPVQIAYLAQVELFDFELLTESIAQFLSHQSLEDEMSKTVENARALLDDPHNFQKQLALRIALTNFLASMNGRIETKMGVLKAIESYQTVTSAANVNTLMEKSFSDISAAKTDKLNNKLFWIKAQTELGKLQDLRAEPLAQLTEREKAVAQTLTGLIEQLPQDGSRWLETAQKILDELEGVR